MRRRLAEQLRQQALKEKKEEEPLPEVVIEVRKKRGRPYGNLRRATEQHS